MSGLKDRILETSYALFTGNGFAATSINDICRASGVTKGGFYHHFESKESLFHELLMEWYVPEARKMLEGLHLAAEDPKAAIKEVFMINGAIVASMWAKREPSETDFGVYYIFLEGIKRDADFAAAMRAYYADYEKTVEAILRRGIEGGAFGAWMNPGATARGIVARTEGAAIMLMADPGADPVAFYETLADECIESITGPTGR